MFHSLSGYNTHLFIRELGAHTSDMEVIVKNKEDYISFSIKVPVDSYIDKNGEEKDKVIELRFIDSFKFMSSSLDSLTKNLVRGGKKLFGFEDYSELQYDLLARKGVYPYEYVNSWDRFNETQLPPIDAFYSKIEKLVPNLRHKMGYVIHIQALNQALQHGLRLDRIHQAIEFDQWPWLKTYIDFSTQLITAATNDFEKDFFKLMNNTVFGKTMENIKKHRNIKLVTTEEKYLHTVMKPNFKSGVLFGENLMSSEMGKIKVVMNKPVFSAKQS